MVNTVGENVHVSKDTKEITAAVKSNVKMMGFVIIINVIVKNNIQEICVSNLSKNN